MNALPNPLPQQLADSQFLSGITDQCRGSVLACAEYRKIAAKEIIFHGGEKATHLFILFSGEAKYYRLNRHGEELLLRWLVPGDVFGIATLLKDPPNYMGSVQTTKNSEAYIWTHPLIRELSGKYPKLAENALRIVIGYLAAFADRHAGLLTKTAEQRLAHTLVHLGNRAGRIHPTGVEVNITNEQLGGLADVGTFTASRVLSRWERNGAVIKGRGKVLIQSPEKLLP